ncbi:MAG: hypothetical protein L0H29_02945 [Sinobacteraceae bacterium]|nr:hypothetical protein [Nevskiaceae bacterium]
MSNKSDKKVRPARNRAVLSPLMAKSHAHDGYGRRKRERGQAKRRIRQGGWS